MGSFPSAVYNITSITQLVPDVEEYELRGDVVDGSGVYSALDFGVNDLVFDAGIFGCFRWKIFELLTPNNPGVELHVKVRWNDEGTPPLPNVGPFSGPGAVCKACAGKYGVATCPSLSLNQAYGYTEILYNTIQNSNDRVTDLGLLTIGGGSGSSGADIKQMQNGHTAIIPAGTPVSKLTNGRIVPADSDAAQGQAYVGITKDEFAVDGLGEIYLLGKNIAGALVGLSFIPGSDIYLGESGGYTDNPGAFSGGNDSIIKLGVADCAAGVASSVATDLIMFTEVITRP